MSDIWETFSDASYFDLWMVRRKTERAWGQGFHLQNGEEAKGLCDLLNRLEHERDKAREQRDVWEKVAILNAEKLGALLFGKP